MLSPLCHKEYYGVRMERSNESKMWVSWAPDNPTSAPLDLAPGCVHGQYTLEGQIGR